MPEYTEHGVARLLTIGEQRLLDTFNQKKLQELGWLLEYAARLYKEAGNKERSYAYQNMGGVVSVIERQMSGEKEVYEKMSKFKAVVVKADD